MIKIFTIFIVIVFIAGCSYREISPGYYWINSLVKHGEQPRTVEEKHAVIAKKAAVLCQGLGYTLEGKPELVMGKKYFYGPVGTKPYLVPDFHYTQYARCGETIKQ